MTAASIGSLAAQDWVEHTPAYKTIDAAAAEAAHRLAAHHHHATDLAPGNGYVYRLVLTTLRPNEVATLGTGGNLLLSLPEFGSCILVRDDGGNLHFPSYVAEKMNLGDPHDTVIAAFLTLFSAHR